MLHWSLLTGTFPILLVVVAGVGASFLLARTGAKHWFTVIVPSIVVGAVLVSLAIAWYVDHIWQPFPDAFPGEATGWIAAVLAALGLLVASLTRKAGWRHRVIAVIAVALIVAAGLNDVNRIYGYYPTLASALGMPTPGQVPLPPMQQAGSAPGTASGGPSDRPVGLARPDDRPSRRAGAGGTNGASGASGANGGDGTTGANGTGGTSGGAPVSTPHLTAPLVNAWHPRQQLPHRGVISEVQIPGIASHFAARPAWVYLPPAYLVAPRPNLPVLILLPGQPGGPRNWIDAGRVQATMDSFAAKHHGLAPVVVLPDPNGSATGNTLCLNSDLGQADTYLSRDVPDWIFGHLQVDHDTTHWAVGGFSYGGTCSFQLAVAHPAMFPTFLDISGGVAPTLGDNARTLSLAFHGDEVAYNAAQPLNVLAADHANPRTARLLRLMAGTFVGGTSDHKYTPQQHIVMRDCQRAGITTRWLSESGAHSWYIAAAALHSEVGWLAGRMRLT